MSTEYGFITSGPGRSDVMQSTTMSGIDRSIQNANIADREKWLVSLRDRKADLG